MKNGTIRQAVILAAGNGSRLASESALPKPLVPVGGRALLDQILGHLRVCGIRDVTLVVGHRGNEIRSNGFSDIEGLNVGWVENPRYHQPNGLSLLAAEEQISSPFLLVMSDHLFETSALRELLTTRIPEHGGVLAVDSKVDQVFDLDDATKVESSDGRVKKIGKDLDRYNAVDTGMFLLSQEVFNAMRKSLALGDASLSGGISQLAQNGGVEAWDIGSRQWIDVDTPDAIRAAEEMLGQGSLR